MYIHEEHARNNVAKKWLKRRYCDEKAESTETVDDSDAPLAGSSEQRSITFERQGISQLAQDLIQAVDEEEVFSAAEMIHSVPTTDSFTRTFPSANYLIILALKNGWDLSTKRPFETGLLALDSFSSLASMGKFITEQHWSKDTTEANALQAKRKNLMEILRLCQIWV
ncbi:hypothetical protein DFH29DRAFT_1073091 [Suillus ampliporus]|nr:hypothetical protein DFH29DRAFT_1073091 [Suillus ampliporus]